MPVRSRREGGKGAPKYLGPSGAKSGIPLRVESQGAAPDPVCPPTRRTMNTPVLTPMEAATVAGSRPETLPALWRSRAEVLRPYAPDAAKVFEECAAILEMALDVTAAELLTLRDAAAFSGYSADHLGRLIRSGRLTNYGRSHSPRLRRSELPRKPSVADQPPRPHLLGATPRQVAQAVASSYHGDRQ
jgi:hypothetical protein